MSISYTKLKNGDWGLRVVGGKPAEGSKVSVTKKDGTTKTEVVGKVLWSSEDGETHLCSINAEAKPGRATVGRGREVCADCGKPGKLVQDLEDGLMKHYRCCDIPPDGY